MRYLVVPAALLIIGRVFLLYVWTDRRRTVRREELNAARHQAGLGILGLERVQKEIGVQVTAGYTDMGALAVLVQDHLDLIKEVPNRKEIKQ